MRTAPELIEVFESVVDAMNGDDTDDYTPALLQFRPLQTGESHPLFTSLSSLLQTVIGSSYRKVQYYAGHPLEIVNLIKDKDWGSQKYEKFPAVCLFLDTAENHGTHQWAYDANNLQLVILWYTEQQYTSQERHEKNFKPILLPIYRELLHQLKEHDDIVEVVEERIKHTKINHYFWGKEGLYGVEGNIFNDYLDCLEIRNLQLNINFLNCQ